MIVCLLGLGAALPASASATHEQGGFITASVTAGGRLQGTLDYLRAGSCTVGTGTGAFPLTVRNPLGATAVVNTNPGTYARCMPNSTTARATFDVDLATAFNQVTPDGGYLVTFSSCCRVGGIVNAVTTDTTFRAQTRKVSGRATSSPVFTSDVAVGVAKGYAFEQFLNTSDPDGGALTYASQAGQTGGPGSDVVSLSQNGVVSMSAATTNAFAHNSRYIYKVRVVDDQGDFSERDVLLRVTGNNAPPAIAGLDGSTPYTVAAGTTRRITFSATDPNNASPKVDTVAITGAGLPAWATLATVPGNPATATLTLSPPTGLPPATLGLNFDALDSDVTVALSGSANIRVAVVGDTVAPDAPVIIGAPAARTADTTARLQFTGEAGGSFECRLDAGAWRPCVSPQPYSGLAAGPHAFAVRQIDAAGNTGAARDFSWEAGVTSPAVAPPRTLRAALPPRATVSVRGDTAMVGCRVSTGTLASCSVRAYALVRRAGRHGVAVTARAARQVYIGRGRIEGASSRLAVRVELNATGRRLLARSLGGLRVHLDLKARTTARTTVTTARRGRFVPERQLVMPATGTFASDSATLTPLGRRFLRVVAKDLRGARSIACAGHTDATGSYAHNVDLGRRRAATACKRLRSLGVAVRLRVRSYGPSRPRASNATSRGRALNRRVELGVRWR